MFNRQLLDELMPADADLVGIASRLCGVDLSVDAFAKALDWMQAFVEKDRFPRPAWKETRKPDGTLWSDYAYAIEARGLEYKNSSCYLTNEGWPTGTQCWYVCVECGFREWIAAERPITALLRGVIVMAVTYKWRELAPDKRPKLPDMIREEMKS